MKRTFDEYLWLAEAVTKLHKRWRNKLEDMVETKREQATKAMRNASDKEFPRLQTLASEWHQMWCVVARASVASYEVSDQTWTEMKELLQQVQAEQIEAAEAARRHHG